MNNNGFGDPATLKGNLSQIKNTVNYAKNNNLDLSKPGDRVLAKFKSSSEYNNAFNKPATTSPISKPNNSVSSGSSSPTTNNQQPTSMKPTTVTSSNTSSSTSTPVSAKPTGVSTSTNNSTGSSTTPSSSTSSSSGFNINAGKPSQQIGNAVNALSNISTHLAKSGMGQK